MCSYYSYVGNNLHSFWLDEQKALKYAKIALLNYVCYLTNFSFLLGTLKVRIMCSPETSYSSIPFSILRLKIVLVSVVKMLKSVLYKCLKSLIFLGPVSH